MRMSTKSRFAVDAMIDLALRESNGPVALAAIAGRQRISLSYLEQLFARLRRQGLVESTRGPGGGYTLGAGAEQISVGDIVDAVEDPLAPARGNVPDLWASLDEVMQRHMAKISLRSLMDEQLARGVTVESKTPRRPIALAPVPKPVAARAPNSVFAFGRSFARD